MCFNPGPKRRVPSPNRYIAVANFCSCKNNKRLMMNIHGIAVRPTVCWVWSDFAEESKGVGCHSPEGSDCAAEDGYEEGDPNAEEGHEEV